MDADLRFWLVAWELPDGTLCSVQTPDDFTRDDVLAIAEGSHRHRPEHRCGPSDAAGGPDVVS